MTIPYLSQQPVDDFGLTVSRIKFSAALAASTDTALNVPSSAKRFKAVITAGLDGTVWFSSGDTAEVPAGSSFASTGSEMVPVNGKLCREVNAGDVLHFISSDAGVNVSVVLYAINNTSGF